MSEYVVADANELGDGDRIVFETAGREICVFNHEGEYHAYLNWCPHQNGPVCEGMLGGTIDAEFDRDSLKVSLTSSREGEVLACPWHGWEFDVTDGRCLSRAGVKLPSYPVRVEDSEIIVDI